MKKLIFTGALCLVVGLSFGQKKAVSAAKNEIKGNNPSIQEARTLIEGALKDPETMNSAEAWFVAGQVENKQFDSEKTKEVMGMKPNEPVMYEALDRIMPYFLKADELDQLPDEKGKVKPKYRKDIRSIIRANRPFYVNAGLYYYEKQNYQKAYENFKLYSDIPEMDIFQGEVFEAPANDSTEVQIKYYAGLAASLIPDYNKSVEIFTSLKNSGYNENEIYQRICYAYEQQKDTVNLINTLKEGLTKFPKESYFLLNLINYSINSGESNEAVDYLNAAIAQTPDDAQLYDVLGQVYENLKDNDKAIAAMKKALEIDPNYGDALSHLGRVYYNMGVETRGLADEIQDDKLYKEKAEEALNYFREAMPYFEKAYELNADDSSAVFALRSIYYNLGMGDKYEKMDAIYNAGQQ